MTETFLMTPPPNAPPPSPNGRAHQPRWPQLVLLGAVLGLSTVGAGLEFWGRGVTAVSVTLLFVVLFNLAILITTKRRQRFLLSLAPYLYITLLLAGWVYAFYFIYPSRLAHHIILATLLLLPTMYAHFFNRFLGQQALLQASGVLLSFLLLSVPHALTTVGGSALFDGLLFTLVFGVSQGLLLSFVAASSWVGDEFKQVRQEAAWFQKLANHDSLTGLPNRRQVEHALNTAATQSSRSGVPCAVLMIDIDHFKRLNDKFGHPTGDEVLRHIAARLRGELRAGNTLGRWGGEEFVVVAPHTELHEAQRLGERLRHAVRSEPAAGEHMVTVSIGITVYRPGDTPETLVARADRALYRAKQGGRDRHEV